MEALSGFLLELYRLARQCPATAFQDRAVGLLAGRIRFDSARWASSNLLPNHRREVRQSHLSRDPPEIHAAYREVMDLDWPMRDLLRKRVYPLRAMHYQSAGVFATKEMAAIRQYQRRFEHENTLIAAFMAPASTNGICHFRHMSLYRAHENHRFEDADLTFMRLALPHLLEAQAINAAAAGFAYGDVDAQVASPSNVVDRIGCLLSENSSLRALLLDEWPSWKPPRLPSLLWESLCREQTFRGKRIVAVARRVQDLMVFHVRVRCLADDLSQREMEVARRIAAGDDHKKIARTLRISPATARNHVQRIHGKLQARNAAGVIAALAPLAAVGDALTPGRAENALGRATQPSA